MPINLKGRSLLSLLDFSAVEIDYFINAALEFKRLKINGVYPGNLKHKNIAAIFLKQSCRTRAAFTVAAFDEGAHLEIFPREDIRFGIKESLKDIARVLGRMFDGIAFRAFEHSTVVELAKWAGVPVWNALCDQYHPTQILADLMTIKERFGSFKNIKIAYIGDGRNNVANSLMIGALKFGIDFRIVAPGSLQPAGQTVERFLTRCREKDPAAVNTVRITADLAEAVKGCDVIYNDVWVSMGEEHLLADRIKLLKSYKVTQEVMRLTENPGTIYLHCLPSLHNLETEAARENPELQEVSDEVFESTNSLVFDQTENRMHTIKAVMVKTIC